MMDFENDFTQMAAIIGEQARATMLWNLLDGRAYTAGELAVCAGISPQSASNHISKMLEANLIAQEKQGRHRYYRLARPEVAYVIESIANLLPPKSENKDPHPGIKNGVKYARTCYDHLAGKLGVAVTDAFVQHKILLPGSGDYQVTPYGTEWFSSVGVDIEEVQRKKRSFAHQCLDWSERRHHLAGALGAAFLNCIMEQDWIRKKQHSREVIVTFKGQERLSTLLKIEP